MRNILIAGWLLAASLVFACTKTPTETSNFSNQTPVVINTPATPAPVPIAGTNPDDEMYKAVEEQECRAYLASIKIVSDCKTITQAERDRFAELHTKTLDATKKPLANEMRKARAQICLQTSNNLQKLVSQCKK